MTLRRGDTARILKLYGVLHKAEGVCKHALNIGYTVENYLKANGFNIDTRWGDKRILVTSHYDDYHGKNWKSYTSYEGFKGFDISKKYGNDAGAEKWELIEKWQSGMGSGWLQETRVGNNYTYMFFVKE